MLEQHPNPRPLVNPSDLESLTGVLVEDLVVLHDLVPPRVVVLTPLVLPGALVQDHRLGL